MKTQKTIALSTIVLTTFLVYFLLFNLYFQPLKALANTLLNSSGLSHIVSYTIAGTPLFITAYLLRGGKEFTNSLGLNGSLLTAFYFSLVCTSPMFLGNAAFFTLNQDITFNSILIKAVGSGFFEELYFRGFLFGLIYRFTKLGFIPSVIFGALVFAAAHMYQSTDIVELTGIFAVTLAGAVLFAWTYAEWRFNIWVSILFHLLMNLSWLLFSVDNNALGGIYVNIFRAVTLILIIAGTIYCKKRNKMPLEVTKRNLWLKH